jgi:glutaminyl-tRNA synthetase
MRDPVIYRIKKEHHHRTGDDWCIYPMYDFAHGQSDSIEGITHSLCSLEFIHHRPLYDWFIEKLEIFPSRQIEFARMNVEYMITSKRKLLKLVNENFVEGWDDPRMPTISGMRRRGYPPAAIRTFCDKAGVAKRENTIEINLLESCVRDELNRTALRAMVVIDPVKVIITNYPEGQSEILKAENNPEDPSSGHRDVLFSRELYIEREDFVENAPPKYFRMTPGSDVRLKHAYILHCTGVTKDNDGNILEITATYYPDSKSGEDVSGIKPKGTLHWVSIADSEPCEIRLYDRLFTVPDPTEDQNVDFLSFYNPKSLELVLNARMESSLMSAQPGMQFQFLRQGYFCVDKSSTSDHIVFNKTVGLKDSFAKEVKKG